MVEKSAIDKIDELYTMMHDLNAKMDLMRHSIQILHNGLLSDLKQSSKPMATTLSPPTQSMPIVKEVSPASTGRIASATKVFGKFIGSNGSPIGSADIKITDADNKVVKRLQTKADGTWETLLPIGKYSIKYTKQGLPPTYRMVNINEGQTEVEAI